MNTQIAALNSRIGRGDLVTDQEFDHHLPQALRQHSALHWTRTGVAMRVARWLNARGVSRVLDVGSGAGKFCVVGALSSDLSFVGVEHRLGLVTAASSLADRFGVSKRATFSYGDLSTMDVRAFDALYFYNPFEENLRPPSQWLDKTVELSRACFRRSVNAAQVLLCNLPVGTYVVTYNGLGGRIPDCFDLVQSKVAGSSLIRLWQKTETVSRGGFWIELGDSTHLKRSGWGKPRPAVDVRRRHLSLVRSKPAWSAIVSCPVGEGFEPKGDLHSKEQ